MQDQDFALFVLLPIMLGVGFFCLVLFGFFEGRNKGVYRFRFRRFIIAVVCLFIVTSLLEFSAVFRMKAMIENASHVAYISVEKNRVIKAYELDNLGTLLPEILADKTKECYRVALSNYIEDQWDLSFRKGLLVQDASFCKMNPSICTGDKVDYYEAIRQVVNPDHILMRDFGTIGYLLGVNWIAAASSYKNMKQLFHQPDAKGQMPQPPDDQMVENYHLYLATCHTLAPISWAEPEAKLTESDATVCMGRCP